MKIAMILEVMDDEDKDPEHPMGITEDASERLSERLMDLGLSIVDGPKQTNLTRVVA